MKMAALPCQSNALCQENQRPASMLNVLRFSILVVQTVAVKMANTAHFSGKMAIITIKCIC